MPDLVFRKRLLYVQWKSGYFAGQCSFVYYCTHVKFLNKEKNLKVQSIFPSFYHCNKTGQKIVLIQTLNTYILDLLNPIYQKLFRTCKKYQEFERSLDQKMVKQILLNNNTIYLEYQKNILNADCMSITQLSLVPRDIL